MMSRRRHVMSRRLGHVRLYIIPPAMQRLLESKAPPCCAFSWLRCRPLLDRDNRSSLTHTSNIILREFSYCPENRNSRTLAFALASVQSSIPPSPLSLASIVFIISVFTNEEYLGMVSGPK